MSTLRRIRLLAIGVVIGSAVTLNWAVSEVERMFPETFK